MQCLSEQEGFDLPYFSYHISLGCCRRRPAYLSPLVEKGRPIWHEPMQNAKKAIQVISLVHTNTWLRSMENFGTAISNTTEITLFHHTSTQLTVEIL